MSALSVAEIVELHLRRVQGLLSLGPVYVKNEETTPSFFMAFIETS